MTERLAQHLDSPEYVADLNQRLERLASAYAEDAFLIGSAIMRRIACCSSFKVRPRGCAVSGAGWICLARA